jgi:D-xylose transport system permease protein
MSTDQSSGVGDNPSGEAGHPSEAQAARADSDFSRDAGAHTGLEFVTDYISRVRGGEVGALPAVLGLLVLVGIFSFASDSFLSVANLANLVSQSGITVFLAMGLVFVLLLGEIDLALGTASGVCAAIMGLTLNAKGDLQTALGTPTFVIVTIFMVAAIAVAVMSRLWIPAGLVGVGILVQTGNVLTTHAIVAIYLAVAFGVAIGLLTGFLVARVGIPSFVVTLALFLGWQGVLLQFIGNGNAISVRQFTLVNDLSNSNLAPLYGWALFLLLMVTYTGYTMWRSVRRRAAELSSEPMTIVLVRAGGLAVIGAAGMFFLGQERGPNPDVVSIKGVPYVLPLMILLMIGWTLILNKTAFGRYIYAVGGNSEAARRAGIDLDRIRIAAFAIGSGMAAIGGVAQASKLGSVPSDAGGGNTLLFAVAAAVIGGTSLFGGKGRARDAVIGGLVIAIIPNGLGLLPNITSSAQFIITALVLLVAASVDALSRKRASATGR